MKKKILFITKDSILKKLLEEGKDPDGRTEALLGYNFLSGEKYEKGYSNLPRGEIRGLVGRVCHFLEIPFRKIVHIGIALEAYPFLKKEIKAADIIFCVNDGIGLGVLFWKKLGFIKAEVIVMMMALPEKAKYLKGIPLINGFLAAILKKAAFVTTLSDIAGESLKKYFYLEPGRVRTFRYGTNIEYWRPQPEIKKEDFIFSIGNDRNRDFQTLIAALPENLSLKIVTKIPVATDKKNVEVSHDFFPGEALKKLYNQALFAVIPSVRLTEESAGLSSDLQLMASGTAVIISRAQAIEEVFTDGVDCLYYEPGNIDDLRKKIMTLLDNKALRDKIAEQGRQKVLNNFTCQKMAAQLEKMLDTL
jgi:glycosyltransferase involved in cell wall biosynthesis